MRISFANPLLVTPERPLPRRVGIVGAGTIGPDIGYYLKSELPDLTLVLVDVAQPALDRAMQRIDGYVEKGLRKRKLSDEQAAAVRANLVATLDYGELAGCDWVIEAATENLELKHQIFAQIEEQVSSDAIITSNTSSLPAERLFTKLSHPGRATVTHFFAPAFRNPAVEVIRWSGGDRSVIEYLRWLFCHTGKTPLLTDDVICFMLDRIFDNWCNDAALLLDQATASEIDAVAADLVQAGPFFVLNMARGNPIIVETNTLQMEEGEHYRPADIFRSVDTWTTGKPGKAMSVEEPKRSALRDRLVGVLLSQSVDILDRRIGTPADLDLGCTVALGFKRGPLSLMAELGADEAGRVLQRFAEERPGMPMPKAELDSYHDFDRHVLVDDVDGVKVLTIRRPQALNALDDEVTDELLHAIRRHETADAVRGFVIVGYGPRAFCAGADIGRFPEMLGDAEAATQYARDCSRLLVHLDSMDKPVVAALNGMALGGGLELALRCHGIVAARHAVLQFPEVTLGIAPGIGGMVVPYRRWPEAADGLHDMLLRGAKLAAPRARELGVIDALADDYTELCELAVRRVGELAGGSRIAMNDPVSIASVPAVTEPKAGKLPLSREVVGIIAAAITAAAAAPTLQEALEIGYAAFGRTACTGAAKEGIAAFGQRRKPDFTKTG
jgi:enoyl-CoA hydratase/3-hydroxyacyl-CoA dehydrogenase